MEHISARLQERVAFHENQVQASSDDTYNAEMQGYTPDQLDSYTREFCREHVSNSRHKKMAALYSEWAAQVSKCATLQQAKEAVQTLAEKEIACLKELGPQKLTLRAANSQKALQLSDTKEALSEPFICISGELVTIGDEVTSFGSDTTKEEIERVAAQYIAEKNDPQTITVERYVNDSGVVDYAVSHTVLISRATNRLLSAKKLKPLDPEVSVALSTIAKVQERLIREFNDELAWLATL